MAGALDALIAGSPSVATSQTTTPAPSKTSALDALISGKPTSATPPTSTIGTDPIQGTLGNGYSSSGIKDTSDRPLLMFENQKLQASQILTDRVAPSTPFNPTVAQKLTPDMFSNSGGRMPESVSTPIKQKMGGVYSDELDHKIALEIGGSNSLTNLMVQPGRTNGGVSAQTDKLENSLAAQVASGKISLIDAQQQLAKAKGYDLPEFGGGAAQSGNPLMNYSDAKKMAGTQAAQPVVPTPTTQPSTPIDSSNFTPGTDLSNSGSTQSQTQSVSNWDSLKNAASDISAGKDPINTTGKAIVNNPKSAAAGAGMAVENFGLGVAKAFVGATGLLGNKQAPGAMKWLNDNQDALNQIAQQNFAGTPDKQTAYTVGTVAGNLLPYYLTGATAGALAESTAIPILSNFGGALTASQVSNVGNVIKEASNVVSFFGTGQIDHSNVEGSRWNQFLSDAVSYAIFRGGTAALDSFSGKMPFQTAEQQMEALKIQGRTSAINELNEYLRKGGRPELETDATDAQIKKAYYSLGHTTHPDVLGGNAEDFKKINSAYSYLSSTAEKPVETTPTPTENPKTLTTTQESPTLQDIVEQPKASLVATESPQTGDKVQTAQSPITPVKTPSEEITQPKTETPVKSSIPPELQPLAKEAQKYPTAQAFKEAIKTNRTPEVDSALQSLISKNKLNTTVGKFKDANGVVGIEDFYNQATKAEPKPLSNEIVKPKEIKDSVEKPTVPEPKEESKDVVLSSGFNPNVDKFIEQDVKPAAKEGVASVAKTWDMIKKTLAPATRGPEAQQTASIMRESLGRMARDKEMVYQTLSKMKKTLDKYTPEQSLELIDGIETGKPVKGTEKLASIIHEALSSRWAKIQEIKGTEAYIENYFPHIWKDPEKASGVLAQSFGKRPLEGSKAYLKQRKIPTIKEGVALGLTPESYNPVDLVMARVADMDRFLMANDIWTQFKENGLRKFVSTGEKPPEDWIKVNDKISTSFQFSPVEKGLILRGSWYMPEKAATIVNNYLSPGLQGNPLYNGLRMISNTLNSVQLGLSGFHALFTSGDAVISNAALNIQKIFSGDGITQKVSALGQTIVAPVTAPYIIFKNLVRGNKLFTDYFKENPEVPKMVDALERAGGRVRMDSLYLNDSVNKFLKALRSGNYIGATLRAPGAIIEQMAKPIMQYLVPRQKLGVFSDLATQIMEQAQKEKWSEPKTTLRLQEAWDSVDNRMGQLVYDNLFWNKALKDLGMASTRSLGWNLGTFRELGGGVKGLATEPIKGIIKATTGKGQGARMNSKMAYTLALPYVVGIWGAMIYYLYNKKAPKQLLDYYYPTTGKTKPDGTPERIALPSYMKDIFAYKINGVSTITDKVNPEISTIIDMLNNQDFYGTEIRNPDDSTVKQIGELMQYQAEQFVPFTISNLINRQQAGDTAWSSYLQSFSGITPAPAYITRTPLQTQISKLYSLRNGQGVQSKGQKAASQLKTDIRTAYMLGNDTKANTLLKQAVDTGVIKQSGVATFIKDANLPSDVKLFQQLPAADQENLLKGMELLDLQRYAWYANAVVKSDLSSLSDNAKTFVQMEKAGTVKIPQWKRGKIISSGQ